MLNAERNPPTKSYENMLKNDLIPSSPEESNARSFRLPNNTIPLSCRINLDTNIHRADFGFHGTVSINIRVVEQSNTITLHSRQLIIRNVVLIDFNGNTIQRNPPITMDTELSNNDHKSSP
jgi:hypothetical protein